jgi:DNA-binding phage protein
MDIKTFLREEIVRRYGSLSAFAVRYCEMGFTSQKLNSMLHPKKDVNLKNVQKIAQTLGLELTLKICPNSGSK